MTTDETTLIALLTPGQRVGLTLYGEARGSSLALRAAIASVIGNRVRAQRDQWGLTADAVCLKRGQFSCWSPAGGVANHEFVIAAAKSMAAGLPLTAALRTCLAIGDEVVADAFTDSVHGATHYYSPLAMIPKHRVPDWAVGLKPVAIVDSTLFFAGVK